MNDGNPCTRDYCQDGGCRHDALRNGTACSGGRCCGGRCSNLREASSCGACGAACTNGSTCKSTSTGGYSCDCVSPNYSDYFCKRIYGSSATCYPSGANAMCNCQQECPNGAACAVVSGTNYCHY